MPFCKTPGNVQCTPPSVVYPQPACRKSELMLLNCLQAIIILLPSVGFTAMDGSFAQLPRMLLPLASTFAWKLVNTPNCEIIRGEVSIFRGGAGGMLYFSRGSFRGSLRIGASVCAETLVIESIQVKPRHRLAAETVEDFIEWIEVVKCEALNRQATCKSRTWNL